MTETGVVKFHYESDDRELAPFPGFEDLNAARQKMREIGLLGVDETGIGFGNVSLRDGTSDAFYITGSGTGMRSELRLQDYAKVIAWDFDRNWLRSEGRVIASAESLTHAAVYSIGSEVCAVLHGHDRKLWRSLCERDVATRPGVPYGTPEMAREVQWLFRETDVRVKKIFAMSGHVGGIVVFGRDFSQALAVLAAARAST